MMVKNLRELGGRPFPYIIPIIPRSLPAEVIERGGGGGGGGILFLLISLSWSLVASLMRLLLWRA